MNLTDEMVFRYIAMALFALFFAIFCGDCDEMCECEHCPLPSKQSPKRTGTRAFLASIVYWISAFIAELVILFGVDQIKMVQELTFTDKAEFERFILTAMAVMAIVFVIFIHCRITRWLLGLIRGHNTLIDNLRIWKEMMAEMLRDDEIIPQNETRVNMLGEFIANCRKQQGLSKAKLAKLSGRSVSDIHSIENGDNTIVDFRLIIDLCDALNVSLDDIRKNDTLHSDEEQYEP